MKKQKGFTLIELLVVIGIIAILASVVIVALNPARQFKQARDTQRAANVNAILNAVGQNMVDNRGVWTCDEDGDAVNDPIPTSTAATISQADYDLYACIVPTYISQMVGDPLTGTNITSSTTYDTQYTIQADTDGRVTIAAPDAELATVSVTR